MLMSMVLYTCVVIPVDSSNAVPTLVLGVFDRSRPLPRAPWSFIGGLLSGWVAVCLPDSEASLAACRDSAVVDAVACRWTTAWCVIGDGALKSYDRGESKGWLPLDKADLQLDFVPSPIKGARQDRVGEDGIVPITLVCGNNYVQLKPVRATHSRFCCVSVFLLRFRVSAAFPCFCCVSVFLLRFSDRCALWVC